MLDEGNETNYSALDFVSIIQRRPQCGYIGWTDVWCGIYLFCAAMLSKRLKIFNIERN